MYNCAHGEVLNIHVGFLETSLTINSFLPPSDTIQCYAATLITSGENLTLTFKVNLYSHMQIIDVFSIMYPRQVRLAA